MLLNYIITAWKVFLRRKFFTFINLFGISLTLMVLMVISTIAESYFYPKGPEKNIDNIRVISRLVLTNEEHNQTNSGRLGYKFIKENLFRLQTPELISINSGSYATSIFHQGKKIRLLVKKTDSNFWSVLDFNFIQGRAFSNEEFNKGRFVAVVNQHTQQELFGETSAIGQKVSIGNQQFTIIGVVENVSIVEEVALSDIWVPYTTNATTDYQQETRGNWDAVLYHSNPAFLEDANKEYINLLKNDVVLDASHDMTEAYSGAYTKLQSLSREMFYDKFSYDTHENIFMGVIVSLVLLFMLLPSINMINLNVSRMMERSSEIGVRKAFGASTKQLLMQFIIESILLTLAGGILGIILSLCILNSIEASGLIPYAHFPFNIRVFFIGLLLILVFGLISGVYPAYKMSRLSPVTALKGGF
jgi:putative ABC transport system permease protein